MAENKPTNRERLREITDGIEQGIKELFESEKYMRDVYKRQGEYPEEKGQADGH